MPAPLTTRGCCLVALFLLPARSTGTHAGSATHLAHWTVDATPITTIGGDERDDQQHFQYVHLARRLDDGRVVIVQGGELRWFSAAGTYLKTMPRAGEGPGEFRGISELLRLAGDTLMMSGDFMQRKVAWYTGTGTFVKQTLMDMAQWNKLGTWEECAMPLFADGSRGGCLPDPSIPITADNRKSVGGDPGPGHLRTMQRLFIVPPALNAVHPLGLFAGIEQFGISTNGRTRFYSHPFYGQSLIAGGGRPLRIAIAQNPAYRIEVWTPEGKLDHVIQRTGARRVPTAAEKRDVEPMMQKTLAGWHDTSSAARILAKIPAPDSLPAFIALVVGTGGEIVAQREGYFPSQTASLFDIFDARGTFLSELRLAPRTRILELGADYVLAVRLDGDDVPHVEVYRLKRG